MELMITRKHKKIIKVIQMIYSSKLSSLSFEYAKKMYLSSFSFYSISESLILSKGSKPGCLAAGSVLTSPLVIRRSIDYGIWGPRNHTGVKIPDSRSTCRPYFSKSNSSTKERCSASNIVDRWCTRGKWCFNDSWSGGRDMGFLTFIFCTFLSSCPQYIHLLYRCSRYVARTNNYNNIIMS